jgi:phasin family protein
MPVNTEQFVAANQAAVDSLLAVANTALASAERIANLNLDAARNALQDGAAGAKALAGAKDVQEAARIQAELSQPALEKAVAYTQSMVAISQQTQEALAKTVEAQFGDFQKSVAGLLAQAAKAAPAGSEGAFAAVQSAIAAANSAFASMNASARQFAESAQTGIAAASKATTAAARKAKK